MEKKVTVDCDKMLEYTGVASDIAEFNNLYHSGITKHIRKKMSKLMRHISIKLHPDKTSTIFNDRCVQYFQTILMGVSRKYNNIK